MRNLVAVCSLVAIVIVSAESLANDVSRLRAQREYYDREATKVMLRMVAYIFDHPGATAATIATGGAVGAFLLENLDDATRGFLLFAGLLGGTYCAQNSANLKECAVVGIELLSYVNEITGHQRKMESLDAQILALQRPSAPAGVPARVVQGSDVKGPEFHRQFPNGAYQSKGNAITLAFWKATTTAPPTLGEIRSWASKVESQLHVETNRYLYTLLEPKGVLILKHASTFQATEEIVGTGMTLSRKDGEYLKVETVVDGAPAKTAGIAPGDYITGIDGVDTGQMSVDDAVSRLRGVRGTRVVLALSRPSPLGPSRSTVPLVRSLVRYQGTQNPTGYIAVYRTEDGRYYYARDDRNEWYDLLPGEELDLAWTAKDSVIRIRIVRPTANADPRDREVDYMYTIR